MRGELLDKFGIYVCDLSVSTLILFDPFTQALSSAFQPYRHIPLQ